MNFADVNSIAIPEGRVRRILRDGKSLWAWSKTAETDIYPLAVNNYWISKTGTISGYDSNWISTDKIPVTDRASVRFGLLGHGSIGTVVAYSESGTVLGCANAPSQYFFEGVYNVPPGTAYITITGCTEEYNTSYFNQYAILTDLIGDVPPYVENGLILLCDGVNNSGLGHDSNVTTWKDLSGNGNDIVSVGDINSTVAATTVQGEWKANGIWVNVKNGQFLRTPNSFDLGSDYTIEMRVRQVSSDYMTLGFKTGTRFKLRLQGNAWWVRVSEKDSGGQQDINPYRAMKPLNTPVTYTVSRFYNEAANYTYYTIYENGVYVARGGYAGIHREGESSYIAVGMENDDLIVHSVRLYNRALTDEEIAANHEYDTLRLGG